MVMSTTAVAPAEARNERIRELRSAGWRLLDIGREVGLSHARVSQILAETPREAEAPSREDRLRAEERAILVELRHLHLAVLGHRERIQRLRTRQRIVEEELMETDIKRLLGV